MMNYLVAFMFPFFAGWSMVAANALWDAPDRPPVLWGAGGRMLMIAIYILTGLLLVTGIAWMFHKLPTAHSIMVIIAGGLAGTAASKRLQVNAAGAINRVAVGTVGLLLAYVIAWVFAHPDQ
jgi:energy-converting hydrogenase Eha subunit C